MDTMNGIILKSMSIAGYGITITGAQGTVEILGAAYGRSEVTSKVHHIYHVQKNKVIEAKNEIFGDSWYGVLKTLVITYRDQ